jgi:hypothetical protein
MPSTANDRWTVTSIGRAKTEEIPARKLRQQTNGSRAVLQARREFIPPGTLKLLLAVVGPERSQTAIVFGPDQVGPLRS